MEFVTDMGAHGRFIWPAYAAFAVIFVGMAWWAVASNKSVRTRLAALEKTRNAKRQTPETTT